MTNPPNSPPPQQPPSAPPRQSIPLQNLNRPPDNLAPGHPRSSTGGSQGAFDPARQQDAQDGRMRYERLSPTTAQLAANLPGITTYWDTPYQHRPGEGVSPESPMDPTAFQFALPPDIRQEHQSMPGGMDESIDPYDNPTPYYDEPQNNDYSESDRAPLTAAAQPMAGRLSAPDGATATPRDSFQTVHDLDASPQRSRDTRMLGFDLEPGFGSRRSHGYGNSLSPVGRTRSRSSSTAGALQRTASIVRAMSQRVVNLSGDEILEQQARRDRSRSRSPSVDGRREHHVSAPMMVDTSYPPQVVQTPLEKKGEPEWSFPSDPAPLPPRPTRMPNPLKGNSLGIFPPDNPIRKRLCDILVWPLTETILLALIVLQAILLAVEASPNVFDPGNGRPDRWGRTRIDWAIFGLFVVFTLELFARIIVSGFILNAPEYSTIDRKRGVRAAVVDQYRTIFQPQRQKSVRKAPQESYGPSTFVRSVTMLQGQRVPETIEEQQRMQLARRAFLRHGFNRLDFIAVVSFWISFVLGISGKEKEHHIYIFRMMSCLRIVRLLSITRGNAIILRSLKKAAPLLVRVSFLIAFFWLLFAIVGVQSFKSSLKRQCVWLDPLDPKNLSASFTNDFEFCGGHLNNDTGDTEPWVYNKPPGELNNLINGTTSGKGFICPRGSICLQQENPFNGTVNFDNILYSLELVFVIMSANTYSDLMYYTTNSDYLPAALYFGAGIMIMLLWLVNLLIAVITSSFQVIREESRASAFTADEDNFMSKRPDEKIKRVSALQRMYNKTQWFWVVCIAFDLLCQSVRSSRMKQDRATFIHNSEIIVTILLDIEIIIRLAANFRRFHRNPRNLVDFALAVITSIILVPPIYNSGQPYAWLSVFQILRAYRVVLAVPMTRKLIQLVLGNATGIGNLMLFVFLMTFLMAIFACQLFRGEIPQQDSSGDDIEITFRSIWNAFLGMYQILSSENWTAILYNVTSYTTGFHTAWVGGVFLIGWFILSFFILVNMFIAVIQENFDVGEDIKRLEQVRAFLQRKELGSNSSNLALSTIFAFGRSRKRKDPLDYGPAMMEMLLKEAVVRDFLDEAMDPLQQTPTEGQTPSSQPTNAGSVKPGILSTIWGKLVSTFTSKDPNPFYSNVRFDSNNEALDPRQMARQVVSASAERRKAQRAYLARHPTYNNSLFMFTPKNKIRRLCQRLVGPGRGTERFDGVEPNKIAWYTFSAFIYITIVVMVVLACVTTPLYQREYFQHHPFSVKNWFVWTDMAFAAVFTGEAMIKVIADGFLWTPNAYFRSSWGIIDAVVLITLWINVITLFTNDGAVSRAVGAFKALRALRLLNVSDSARETFHSLIIIGWWKILSAAFVSISLLIPFAIYGVTLFNGQLVQCNDSDGIRILQNCFAEFNSTPFNSDWPMLAPRVAANPYFSFDDFGSSLFILFQIVSQEGWVDVSFAAQAITGKGLQPEFQASQGNAVFFVVFNLLATVFVLTLFISVFMRNYTEQTGVAFLTAEQRSWLELRKLLRQISPSKSSYDESKKKWKKWCHKRAIEKRGKWYIGITVILVFHLILLLLEFYQEPEWWTRTRDIIFLVFTLIYMANILIRVIGLGWSRFRRSSWDLYSLVAVTGAFATSVLFLTRTHYDTYIQLHKFFLVAIVLLLIPRNDALDQLFKTAAASLTTIGNLLATWLVFFLVFAIGLTQTFSLTRFGESEDNNVNLRTVPNALILLFRMSTGEGWNQIMEDFATVKPPFCVESSEFYDSDCGSTAWARVLFIAWNILSMYIFVNLFVSLIYESFSYVYQRSSGLAVVDRDEIRRFKEAWRSVDPAGTGFISKEAFPRLLGELSGVFEMRIYDAEDSVSQILEDVRSDVRTSRHTSIATQSAYSGVDIVKLNQRLAQIDVAKVRERRRRFNIFFEEVMVSADPDRGISFTTVLMILAHYNIISDSKSLRLEEFLRRRARLQRVEEEVRRRIVLGFFDTLYWSRKFKRHMENKRSARMTGVPQLDVPDILVDDEEEREARKSRQQSVASAAGEAPHRASSTFLSPEEARAHHRTWSGASQDLSLHDTNYAHPLSLPRAQPMTPGGQHRSTVSAFSFELQEPNSEHNSAASSRRGSAVSPAQVREMLDDSVWVESIRRSATMRRPPDWGGYR